MSSGMAVQDRSGQTIGTVSDVVRANSGRRGYVVVSGADGSTTPVPYRVASSMTKNGIVVLDRAAFERAPKVKQSQLSGRSGTRWQTRVDRYWTRHTE